MCLEHDNQQLYTYVQELRVACKRHTASDIVAGCIPITTVYHFLYDMHDESLAITSVTLSKIARRVDELDNSDYEHKLKALIKNYVERYILVTNKPLLVRCGLTYDVMNKIGDYTLKKSYRLSTLPKYAMLVKENLKEGVNE